MIKFSIILLVSILILNNCYGCSFVQKQETQPAQQKEQQPEKKAEPIPVNPQHS